MHDEVIISDMSTCIPQEAFSRSRKKYCWQLIEYEAEGNTKGILMSAGPETEAPDVVCRLGLDGWYAIYIGLWGRKDPLVANLDIGMIKVRLKDDPCFTSIRSEAQDLGSIEETFWKYANLTNQHLVIGQRKKGVKNTASIAYMRLVPLSSKSARQIQLDWKEKKHKKLIAANDAFGIFFYNRITEEEEIWEYVEPFRNTDFGMVFWEMSSGWFGEAPGSRIYGQDVQDFPRLLDRNVSESYRILNAKGIDPLATAMNYSHEIGLEFHVSQRMEWFQAAPPYEELFTTDFYAAHPEYRLVDREGTEVTGMSYAFPEVRRYMISLFGKAASCGADGVAAVFSKAPPFLLYEGPLVDGFKKEFGVDPREMDENDETWLSFRGRFMTQFMRELREEMDKVGKKLKRRLQVSAMVLATRDVNIFFGLDPEAWIEEGLVDNLIPYPRRIFYPAVFDRYPVEIDMAYFARITKGTDCRIYPNVLPKQMPARDYRAKALGYYSAGADGLFFWDTYKRHINTAQWTTLRRLGHIEELRASSNNDSDTQEPKLIKIARLGGHNMRRYSPNRGG